MANIHRLKMLKKLISNLIEVAGENPEIINLDVFACKTTGEPLPSQLSNNEINEANKCGTIACIAGWAAMSKEFNEEGLHLDDNERPSFNGKKSFRALAEFFEVKKSVLYSLFHPAYYSKEPKYFMRNPSKEILTTAYERVDCIIYPIELFNVEQKQKEFQKDRFNAATNILKNLRLDSTNQQFNMNCWISEDMEEEVCHTTACAAGWLAQNNVMQQQGLCLQDNVVFFNNKEGFDAISDFFGITAEETLHLFAPEFYKETVDNAALKDVIERMELLARDYNEHLRINSN